MNFGKGWFQIFLWVQLNRIYFMVQLVEITL